MHVMAEYILFHCCLVVCDNTACSHFQSVKYNSLVSGLDSMPTPGKKVYKHISEKGRTISLRSAADSEQTTAQ